MEPAQRASFEHPLSRRRFGQLVAGGLASLALPSSAAGSASDGALPPLPADGETSTVVLAGVRRAAGEEAVETAVRRAALAASDFSWLSRGDTVLIKPVCNSGNPYPATSDPVALRAVIRLLRDRGAGRVLVADMSGVQFVRFGPDRLRGSTRALMQKNRMNRAIEDAGAELHAFEEQGWDAFHEETPARAESWPQPVMMPDVLREVDHLVLMPRCARHLLAGSTLGLKAAVGWWRHDTRLVYHRGGATLPEKTAEANTVPSIAQKQRLVLTSATKVLSTFGPDNGYVVEPETGLIIASSSLVAHDMVSLAWLLESHRATPPGERNGAFDDPHRSALFVAIANRVVTGFLGGFGQALRAQAPPRSDLDSIWHDRVLRRAFEVLGGVPRVELADAGGAVDAPAQGALAAAVQRQA